MGGQARRSLYRHRLGLRARQICFKIKLISRLGAGPSLFLSRSIHLLSLRFYCPPAFTRLISLSFSLSSLGISRTRANRRHGTEMKAKKEVGRRSSVPPTRTQRREEKVAQQQRALDFWLRPSQGRSHFIPWRNIKTLYLYFEIMRSIAMRKLETKKIKKAELKI